MIAIVVVFTVMIALSFVASLLDGVLVSATVADVEVLKRKSPKAGRVFEKFQDHPDRPLSAVLAMDTTATTIGSVFLGALVLKHWGESAVIPFSIASTIISFVFSDILPKTLGVFHRRKLLALVIFPIQLVQWTMWPVSILCSLVLRTFLPKNRIHEELSDESIILTAKRGVEDGILSSVEGQMLEHTLTLDDVAVETIVQKKVFSLPKNVTVESVFRKYAEIPYGRIPIYDGPKSNLIGIVRRRDLLKAMAKDHYSDTMESLCRPTVRIPKVAKISSALDILTQHFQQIAIVENEDHRPMGVVTIEDIFEYILGRDIFEYDDISNDTRSDARKLRHQQRKPRQR